VGLDVPRHGGLFEVLHRAVVVIHLVAVLTRRALPGIGTRGGRGNAHRAWTFTRDKVKKASLGTGLPCTLEKQRSRPSVVLPALVTTTSSPASR
jgi:hypothetical protein